MEATCKHRRRRGLPNERRSPKRSAFTLAILAVIVTGGFISCARTTAFSSSSSIDPGPGASSHPNAATSLDAGSNHGEIVADAAPVIAELPWAPSLSRVDGPFETLSLDAGRPIYYAFPRANLDAGLGSPFRLVGHLHGMCGPPPYACGKWLSAGTDVGAMVCPTGNARCGDSPVGPPSWEAPTWLELVGIMDRDLEISVAKVEGRRRGSIRKEGAVLTGYSRGAYAAPVIARSHPNRWRFLILIEANAPLSAPSLRASGVRAVALVAGEQGDQIAGMRKTESDLEREGFPAKLFVMKKTGHLYSEDMEYVMHDALRFVLSYESTPDGG